MKDLKAILPFVDTIVAIKCTGAQIYQALENGVSQFPKLDGRFPQVAGIVFFFDPSQPSGERIKAESIKIQNQTIDLKQEYIVATKVFLANGRDGYIMFKNCNYVIDEESGPTLFTIVENHFKAIEQIKANVIPQHRPSLVSINKRNRILEEMLKTSPAIKQNNISFHTIAKIVMNTISGYQSHHHRHDSIIHNEIINIKDSDEFKEKIRKHEERSIRLQPEIENRIVRIEKGC